MPTVLYNMEDISDVKDVLKNHIKIYFLMAAFNDEYYRDFFLNLQKNIQIYSVFSDDIGNQYDII